MVSVAVFLMRWYTVTEKKKYARAVKCPHCEGKLDRNTEDFVEHSARFYHKACFAERFAEINDREVLYEYICKLHNLDFVNGFIRKQVKEYQEPPFNFTLKGILTTLKYAHEVERVPIKKDVGIGIIEYYYKKAINYHKNLIQIRKASDKIEEYKSEIVYTRPPKKRPSRMIDIGGL